MTKNSKTGSERTSEKSTQMLENDSKIQISNKLGIKKITDSVTFPNQEYQLFKF
jgi:hypothetical protein